MPVYKSGEDYLETILILSKNSSYVRSIDIATEMGYSKASVSRAVGILKSEGLIVIGNDGEIKLTEAGLKKASSVYDRHILLKTFFMECLKVSESTAEQDACKIEHVISEETCIKLKNFLNTYNDNNL
ncbi:MAG: metal-dependent transcriptional regulator [Ruminococcus sp.]|nr:metal-dependent transcriptional regulator [Ruminococcus sp.]